jgi:hypothetical protein
MAVHAPTPADSAKLAQCLIYPQLLVCLECRFTEFSVPEAVLLDLGFGKKE